MTILIDPTSATPLYEQIVQQIQRQILRQTRSQSRPRRSLPERRTKQTPLQRRKYVSVS